MSITILPLKQSTRTRHF